MELLTPNHTLNSLTQVLTRAAELILQERSRQDGKWGLQRHSHADWLVIVTEELGEVCAEIQAVTADSTRREHLRKELVQVAACLVLWLESELDDNV
jgi:NTP pyrophosphatase (non-canonical NTP hydrolase)